MRLIDCLILIVVLIICLSVIGNYIYKRYKKIPTGECSCCSKKTKKLVKKIRNIKL